MSSWVTHRSRVAYENPWIRVREDAVTRPDGQPGIYGVVEVRAPAVFVVPVTTDGKIVLVSVDRYTTGDSSLEVPAGGAAPTPGGTPPDPPDVEADDVLTAAQRELREETGLAADDWRDLGPVYSLNGVAAAPGRVFLAAGLRVVPGADQHTEGITGSRTVAVADLLQLVADQAITDNESLAALFLALVALGRVH